MPRSFAGALFVLVVAALVTVPIWFSRLLASEASVPLARPRGEACVEPASVMRKQHMAMLYQWREEVVRGSGANHRTYVNASGLSFEKSLSGTCLACHGSHEAFCDQCHKRASVSITCFNCHNSPGDSRLVPGASEASNVRP
jgi:hypothetical protein